MEKDFDPVHFYNTVGNIYDRDTHPEIFNPRGRYEQGFAVLIFQLQPETILEVGCGTGKRTRAILAYYDDRQVPAPKITVIDPSSVMLDQIPEDIKARITIINSKDTSQFADNSFDLVFSSGVLCSIPTDVSSKVVKESHRIAKKWFLHTDTPKDRPHLNDLDFYRFFAEAGCKLIYWNSIYPYPIPNEQEHQIIAEKTGNEKFAEHFHLRSKAAQYSESWKEVLDARLKSAGIVWGTNKLF
jgi:ubiquinone/menaquinone biosynthesis C-methylase UbiE